MMDDPARSRALDTAWDVALRALAMAWAIVGLWALVLALSAPAQAQPIPAAAHQYRAELVRAAHTQWGLHAPIAMLAAQVHQESAWRPEAVSRVGAQGLAQFMPATATWWCQQRGISAADCLPHNPAWALRAMVGYNLWLHQRTPAQHSHFDRIWAMLRAYNGGLGHWQAERRLASADTRQAIDAACGRARRHSSHCPENLGYPARILLHLQPRYRSWGPMVELPAAPTPPSGGT
ncbi:transglycosylase SLT domain-containing protein [Serpentinimonas maccroryi]|uniref:transglycosylase SLT domain-containing protein n=1 Tax=Serpentinimonas maccroryi TaxID=1458426 RepID=UPI0020349B43|nr:transglycosylase SLT domain-containing protein [Serpentinimonas maccroryi]